MSRTCPVCGRTWTDDATFCGACGALLGSAGDTAAADGPATAPRRGRRALVAMLAVAVVVGVVVAVPAIDVPGLRAGDVGDDTVALPTAPDATSTAATDGPGPVRCTRARVPVDCLAWDVETGAPISLGPRLPGAEILVNRHPDGLTARDPGTGQVRWVRDDLGDVVPLMVVDDVLVVGGPGQPVRGLALGDGRGLWTAAGLQGVGPLAGLEPGVVVLGRPAAGTRGASALVALDPATGTVQWEWVVPWPGTVETAAQPAGSSGVLATGAGRLARVDAATGATTWVVDTLTGGYLQPQAPDHVSVQQLLGDEGEQLWVHDVTTGAVAHRMPAERVAAHLVVDGVAVVHAPSEGVVRGMDLATGDRLWELLTTDAGALGFPVTRDAHGVVVVLDRDARRVTRLDPRTGEPLWQVRLPPTSPPPSGSSTFFGQPMVLDDVVVVEDTSSVVTVLDVATGRERVQVGGDPQLDVRSLDPLTLVQGSRWMRVAIPPADEPGQ